MKSKELLSYARFNLREWHSNDEENRMVEGGIQNVLGLLWYCDTDEMGCNLKALNVPMLVLTKRSLLSIAQQIFDPIGILSPVTVVPKYLLQKSWSLKLGWDDELPCEMRKEFDLWIKNLLLVKECKIPRRILVSINSSIHVFCDASKMAYASCIFMRTEINSTIHLVLMIAKTRITSIKKKLTLPRLELMAALIGVRLYFSIQKAYADILVFFWPDSTVALTWITTEGPWTVFVNNRVSEIRKFSKTESWRHIPGKSNPADLLTRGCNPSLLIKSEWWKGPLWLKNLPEDWPSTVYIPDIKQVVKEKRKSVVMSYIANSEDILERIANRFSNYKSIVRTIAWVLRMKPENRKEQKGFDISGAEFVKAERLIFRYIQQKIFGNKANHESLKNLSILIDPEGIMHLKTRLTEDNDTLEHIYPIILPSKHIVIERLITEEHLNCNHAGVLTLLTMLRDRVWILKARKTIKMVIRRCIKCQRHETKALKVPMPPLPMNRTRLTATFEITGVDLAGPLFLRTKEKCWIVIFTCAVYRAVHLEFVQALSSGAFIQALRRFTARRGRVSIIYSDNGTNFVGVNRALIQLDWEEIQKKTSMDRIVWKFNPPAAPWWGGFWERLIRILKDLLKKNLSRAALTYEELNTLICECEGIMNERPLTYVSEDTDEVRVLRPSMFIRSLSSSNEMPDLDKIEKVSLAKRWNYSKVERKFEKTF